MNSKILLLALTFAAAQADSNFRNCFCFESDGTWCGADSSNHFWRESCKNWTLNALYWTIPAFVFWIGFLFFPFFFFAARMCCNCCGGRQPTEGCCCPSKPSVRVFDDGHEEPIPRRYTNRSIFCTKFFFCACFGLWIYYSVGIFVINHRVNDALNDVTSGISAQSTSINHLIDQTVNATQQLVANGAPFITANVVSDLQQAQSTYQSVDDDIQKILNNIREAENQQQWGRYEDAFRVPSIALCILVPAFFMMLCNCHNAALTIGAGLMSFSAVLVVTLFIGHELVAQASTALCENYNDTLVPSVVNAAIWGKGCGEAGITNDMSSASESYFTEACKNGLADLCNSGFQCPTNAYQNLCEDASIIGESSIYGWQTLSQLLNETFESSYVTNDAGCNAQIGGSMCTISQCATYCSTAQYQQDSTLLVNFMNSYSDAMNVVVSDFYPAYANCTALSEALLSSDIHGVLCNDFSTQYTNISIQFLALSCLSIAAVILLILGAKRFKKMEKVEETGGRGSTFAYRVLLQNDQERAVMGSPLLGSGTNHNGYPSVSEPIVGLAMDSTATYGSLQQNAQALNRQQSETSMCTVAA
eukprot:TRINITY_DN4701_c0_g1_i16.p1 TRINITY_DN4701_c0_g1~~TRINITY_DN4701_c0_g1_i16.p1  ORF type:complete len:589 (+),score=50.41 TRINITY_DN4701_c0_g1_i16:135-1901(+)